MDIGGTTTDIAFVTGTTPRLLAKGETLRPRSARPLPEVWSLGLGGGSIARLANGNLTLGPESAGGLPGPASFDLGGTDATVTMPVSPWAFSPQMVFFRVAGVACGLISPRARLRDWHPRQSRRKPPPSSRRPSRNRWRQPSDRMAAASIWLGREYWPWAAGAVCTPASIAAKLGLHDVDIFPFSAAFGAFGASTLDVVHVYQASLEGQDATSGRLPLGAWYRELVAAARRDVEDEGFAASDLVFELVLEHAAAEPGGIPAISDMP